jgi:hypothetical protein
MNMRTRTILLWSGVAILVVAGVVTLSFAFGGSKDASVEDVNAAYTNAAFTIAAQQQTLQAGMPSATPNPPLNMPTATLTLLPAAFQQQTPALIPTVKPAAGGAGTGGITGCDVAVFVDDVTIPDGTTIPAGQSFTKTWKVSNTGSCAWTATYQLTFVSGDSLGGKATAIGQTIAPGQTADVSVILTSSSAKGNITGTWRLSNDKAQLFGDSLTVVVNSGTAASTATVIATSTATSVAYP